MKQYEQVIDVMKNNGGYATLGFLNYSVNVSNWKTKTPYASIRRIVQDERLFFKIKPGLWALKEFKDVVLKKFKIKENNSDEEKNIFSHSYYQGLIVEIGKTKGYLTYIPPQDKNKLFLEKPLHNIVNTTEIFNFSYTNTVKRAKSIDVIWFNDRNMPFSFFEVEHSTDIQNSLLKFDDLQDFYTEFYIVSSLDRKREFETKLNRNAFRNIKKRVKFIDYEFISRVHTKSIELQKTGDFL